MVLGAFAASVVGFVAFARVDLRQEEPLLDLRRFAARAISGANAVMLLSTAVMCSVLFFVSLYLQTALGFVAPFAGRLTDRVGSRAGDRSSRHSEITAAAYAGLTVAGRRSSAAVKGVVQRVSGVVTMVTLVVRSGALLFGRV